MGLSSCGTPPDEAHPGHQGDDVVEGHDTFDLLTGHARAIERHGRAGALLGTGWGRPDTFTVAPALVGRTTAFQPLGAVRPGHWQPAHVAPRAATPDHLSGGRVLVDVVSGTDDLAACGDHERDPTDRYPHRGDPRGRAQAVDRGARHLHLIHGGSRTYPGVRFGDILARFAAWSADAPDELTTAPSSAPATARSPPQPNASTRPQTGGCVRFVDGRRQLTRLRAGDVTPARAGCRCPGRRRSTS